MAEVLNERPYKKPTVTDFIGWCIIHLVLSLVTLGIWLVILNLWIIYKLDRATA